MLADRADGEDPASLDKPSIVDEMADIEGVLIELDRASVNVERLLIVDGVENTDDSLVDVVTDEDSIYDVDEGEVNGKSSGDSAEDAADSDADDVPIVDVDTSADEAMIEDNTRPFDVVVDEIDGLLDEDRVGGVNRLDDKTRVLDEFTVLLRVVGVMLTEEVLTEVEIFFEVLVGCFGLLVGRRVEDRVDEITGVDDLCVLMCVIELARVVVAPMWDELACEVLGFGFTPVDDDRFDDGDEEDERKDFLFFGFVVAVKLT